MFRVLVIDFEKDTIFKDEDILVDFLTVPEVDLRHDSSAFLILFESSPQSIIVISNILINVGAETRGLHEV